MVEPYAWGCTVAGIVHSQAQSAAAAAESAVAAVVSAAAPAVFAAAIFAVSAAKGGVEFDPVASIGANEATTF